MTKKKLEMIDLSVIILTKDEKLHIARCLEKLLPLFADGLPRDCVARNDVVCDDGDNPHRHCEASQRDAVAIHPKLLAGCVFVVDCHSTDGTQEIARSYGAEVVEHTWPRCQAKQFNWALDNLPIKTKWVLRLDADEYLTPATIEGLKSLLPLPDDVGGVTLELKRRFCGGEIRHGTNGIRLLRIFRSDVGRCEARSMDEHITVGDQRVIDFDGAFYDDNLNDMDWWREKHRGYAKREAVDALAFYRGEVNFKRSKALYYKQPPYLRALIYFCIRYFLKGGFLDGRAGWMWHFWQGLWYRWMVDTRIQEIKTACGKDPEKIREYIQSRVV